MWRPELGSDQEEKYFVTDDQSHLVIGLTPVCDVKSSVALVGSLKPKHQTLNPKTPKKAKVCPLRPQDCTTLAETLFDLSPSVFQMCGGLNRGQVKGLVQAAAVEGALRKVGKALYIGVR